MRKKRRKWIKEDVCFVCHDVFEEDELEPCQCFQEHGVKGFGMVFCQNCDDDGMYHYCAGPCGERLCFRSCDYSSCHECGEVYCQKCLDSDDVLFFVEFVRKCTVKAALQIPSVIVCRCLPSATFVIRRAAKLAIRRFEHVTFVVKRRYVTIA